MLGGKMGESERKKKRYCSVPECKCSDAEPLIFHRFPKDDEAKVRWKSACKITKDITVHMFVCSRHFKQEDYVSDLDAKVQRLKKGTTPSQNLPKDIPKLVPFAGVKRKRINDPFHNEIANILRSMVHDKEEEVPVPATFPENGIRRKCYIPHCMEKPNDDRFYHYFPQNNKIRQQWMDICGLNEKVKPYMSVCSMHFQPNDYLIGPETNKPILKSQAVPSLNISSNIHRSAQPRSNDAKEKLKIQEPKITTHEKADTIIYTASNANDLINFIENFTEDSKDLPDNYLDSSIVIAQQLNEDLDNNLDLFEDNHNQQNGNAADPPSVGRSTDHRPGEAKDETSAAKRTGSDQDDSGHGKVVVKKSERVNMVIKRNGSGRNFIIHRKAKPEIVVPLKQGVAALSLCSECGQHCKIEEVDRLDGELVRTKNPETLAAQTLLELQSVEPTDAIEHSILVRKGLEICERTLRGESVHLMDLLASDRELEAFTGLTSFESLDKLTKLVGLYEGNHLAFKRFEGARDRVVMCLCKLRTNLSFGCLARLFGLRQQVLANCFFTMTRTLAVLMEKTINWPRAEELSKGLPVQFQAFKQTRALLSCMEMDIDKLRCPKCRSLGNDANSEIDTSHGKGGCETVKLVLGVSPGGSIIFKSNVFKGQRSNGSIFTQTNILGCLDPGREAIMTDGSLDIEVECAERNISLIKLPRLDKDGIIDASDLELAKNVCTARLHVQRALRRFRTFKVVQSKITWRILPYVNEICTVIAGVVNMGNLTPQDETRLQLSFLR